MTGAEECTLLQAGQAKQNWAKNRAEQTEQKQALSKQTEIYQTRIKLVQTKNPSETEEEKQHLDTQG